LLSTAKKRGKRNLSLSLFFVLFSLSLSPSSMVTFDAELFGSRLGRLYSSWRVRGVAAGGGGEDGREKRSIRFRRRPSIDGRRAHRCSLSLALASAFSSSHAHIRRSLSLETKKIINQSGEGWAPPAAATNGDDAAAAAPLTSSTPPPAALALAAGSSSDELRYRKTTAMHLWLFTYELPGKRKEEIKGRKKGAFRRERWMREGSEKNRWDRRFFFSVFVFVFVFVVLTRLHQPRPPLLKTKKKQTPSWSSPRRSSMSSPPRRRRLS
jgi:hypothetical protein